MWFWTIFSLGAPEITHFCPVMSTFRLNSRALWSAGGRQEDSRSGYEFSRVACARTGVIVTVLRFRCEGIR